MSVLPSPSRPSQHRSVSDSTTVFVSGDSGGGITAFELRQVTNATRGGHRESRSHPVGRWMAPGKRPVLCLAHARVTTAAANVVTGAALSASATQHLTVRPPAVVDLIATGDTGGTVTIWQYIPGSGGDCGAALPCGDAVGPSRDGADVRGGFVHRGPAGRRRGGERASPEGNIGGESPPLPGLVRVLDYRAHQVTWEVEGRHKYGRSTAQRCWRAPAERRCWEGECRCADVAFSIQSIPPDCSSLRSPLPRALAVIYQMGVLCMAVHVPEEGGRVIIITGGDDQAICVAEVEVLLNGHPAKTSGDYSPRGEGGGHDHAGGPSGETSTGRFGCETRPLRYFCTEQGICVGAFVRSSATPCM